MNIEQLTKLQQELNAANERIKKLGLDDRDLGEKMADGIADMLRSGEITVNNGEFKYNKKDTKMIDLSPAKSGDKFVLNNGTIVTFFARTLMNSICTLDSGHAMVYHHNGKFDESVEPNDNKSNWDIVSKHDPRHWLSQLPDAGLFRGYWLACSDSCNNSEWHVWDEEPSEGLTSWVKKPCGNIFCERVTAIKMPKLTGDEWKLSKISIDELRAWQAANLQ